MIAASASRATSTWLEGYSVIGTGADRNGHAGDASGRLRVDAVIREANRRLRAAT